MLPGEVGTRAAVRLDDFYNTDLSLTKYFALPAGHRLQFRAEAFNAFNNVNFTNVSLDASSPNSFGQFTASGAGAGDAVRASLRVLERRWSPIQSDGSGMKRLLLALAAFGPLALVRVALSAPARGPVAGTPTPDASSSRRTSGRFSPRTASAATATAPRGGLRLDSREAALKGGKSGPAIVARRSRQEPADGRGAAHAAR